MRRSRLPRRREELSEEGDLPLERSKHVCRPHHQKTDCDARESGIPPTLLVTRHARNSSGSSRQKRQPQQASQSQHKKWPPQQQSKRDTRYPPTLLQKRSHPPRLRCSQGRRARQAHEEPGKLLQKTDGRAAMDAPPEQEGRPPLLQATGG